MRSRRPLYTLFALSISLIMLSCGTLKAQFDSLVFKDDPVAAMLDSLSRLNFFSKPVKPAKVKYNYSPDSVPHFDDVVYESRIAKLDAASPFDFVYNEPVRGFIDLYVVRKRMLVSRMLGLAQLYYPMMEEVLDKYGLPLELKHLAVIESALNPNAKSRSGAMGLWQFMYHTGKLYGLENTSYVDDRCDPYKATVAAAEYLKFLYSLFGDWQMVLAAYNSGPGTVNKAIRRSGGKKTYWEIRPYLPRETQSYVPAFIAANYVMNYAAEHNIYPAVPKRSFFETDTVNVRQQISFDQVATVLDIPVDELIFLNPMYKRGVVPLAVDAHPYELILPAEKVGSFINNEKTIYSCLKKDSASANLASAVEIKKVYTVQRGDHLTTIARAFKCTVDDIKTWNGLPGYSVRPGQKLVLYTPANMTALAQQPVQKPQAAPAPQKITANAMPSNGKIIYYTIQKGDTLWTIGQRYKMTVDEIKRLNGFGKVYKLTPGSKIKVSKA